MRSLFYLQRPYMKTTTMKTATAMTSSSLSSPRAKKSWAAPALFSYGTLAAITAAKEAAGNDGFNTDNPQDFGCPSGTVGPFCGSNDEFPPLQ